jgi:type IV pilus assembly protein PilQ
MKQTTTLRITSELSFPKKILLGKSIAVLSALFFLFSQPMYTQASAQQNAIEAISYSTLPGNRIQINIRLSQDAEDPLSFTIDNPARIAFDFNNTISKLPKRKQNISVGIAQSITTVTAKNKTRVIINLTETVPYQISTLKNEVSIVLDSDGSTSSPFSGAGGLADMAEERVTATGKGIVNIDFRRGEKGEGRVIIKLTDANIPMDISEEFGKVIINFVNANLPAKLHQRLDVLDFATPVKSIDSFEQDGQTRIEITPSITDYEHLAYQSDNVFVVEFISVSKEDREDQRKAKFGYTGERLSLNFQDIPIRAVLQLIADFTGLNVVVSDSVDGNLTLRLKNVPWDQALDIILKAKGLSKRLSGNVMLVAPSEEIAAQEKLDLEAHQQIVELSPLRSAYFEINFAKATDLATLFTATGDGEGTSSSLLSARGSVIIDERTNTLIIKDTEEIISEARRILSKLDVPVRQVLIESRIVIATDNFNKELGARFGVTNVQANGNTGASATSGSLFSNDISIDSAIDNITSNGNPLPISIGGTERLNVDMPVVGATGAIAFSILRGGNLLDLELSALQSEEIGEVVSSPRIVTADRHEAFIEQGVEIPYLSASSSGATQVQFKKAVLSIRVTPQITPDDRIIMDLNVTKDDVGQVFANIPSINTQEVSTQVLVNNGDTVVLGGIFENKTRNEINKVPVLGDLPLIGVLFRHSLESIEKKELLVFVTPKILKDSLNF